jgi:transmembrane sensor
MTRKAQDASSHRLDEAIAWHVRINSSDADETAWKEFASWLASDDANRIAFDHVEDFDSELTTLRPALAPMTAQAGVNAKSEYWMQTLRRIRPSRRVWMTGAAVLAASIVLVAALVTSGLKPIEYATRVGETRTVMLTGGTKIDMNTSTKILVASEGSGRQVVLAQGEALFHVAQDPAHPFMVTVGDRDVRDVGTVFNILRNEGVITVVVAEGKVAVSPHDRTQNIDEIRLAQGDQLVHSEENGTTTVEHVDIARALAWRDGYLIYDNAPLSKVVRDLNRYFPSHVILENNAVATRHFSGVLRMDNENAVLERISQFLPVSVQYHPNGDIVLRNDTNSD